ncbi:MAG: heavy metal translocating P-type ATPase [Desulfovibrio sp.]|jgi:Cu2+-exporting ATPase|nr:heavy metal translocating P-type ATPase [Desulfovibrio sp.]
MAVVVAGIAYDVVHETPGRMRLRPGGRRRCSARDFAAFLEPLGSGIHIDVAEITGSALITYTQIDKLRNALRRLAGLPALLPQPSRESAETASIRSADTPPAVRNPIPFKILSFILPNVVGYVVAGWRALPRILQGIGEVLSGRLGIESLDAAALVTCIFRRDFRALSTIAFFLSLGSFLEYTTRKKSRDNLAQSLALDVSHVWITEGGVEREILMDNLRIGDVVIVRTGSAIPVDGTVVSGEALVNQAGMTGEPLPVRRSTGASVYAGTVVEEGELQIRTTKVGGERRIDAILHYIEESEAVKAGIQSRYERIADRIVPYNFLLALVVLALTRSALRAGAVLLVDFSCAIRLTTPLTVLSAMREAAIHGALVKGGRFLEALAEADVLLFDKTGTLTQASPEVAQVVSFSKNHDADAVLRLSACIEEHFPHPVGRAIVRAAERKALNHREEHADVEFVVAHGIATRLRGDRVIIGSRHFLVEDEGVVPGKSQEAAIRKQTAQGRSVLYLAVGGRLVGIIAVEDKLRPGMREFVEKLRETGFRRIIMLTGDEEATARAVAGQAGIHEYMAKLLPEDKARQVAALRKEGCHTLMMGDGVNDAPALSAADVGVALGQGADVTREIADVVLTRGEPADLLPAREIARLALERIRRNFHASVAWNACFLTAATIGLLRPGLSALFHNACTAALAVASMQPLLQDGAMDGEEPTMKETT